MRSALVVDQPKDGHLEAALTRRTRPGPIQLEDASGSNVERNGATSRQLSGRTTSGTESESSTSANLGTSRQEHDLPDAYVLVVVSEIFLFVPVIAWPKHPEFCLALGGFGGSALAARRIRSSSSAVWMAQAGAI